jgi:NAD(P)H-dependent FMN reductase
MTKIAAMTGSVRTGSLNVALARTALQAAAGHGAEIDEINLGAYPLPIYDGTVEELHGPPITAVALVERLSTADGLIIASPEFNGGPTGLLKNTIDWVTRVDMVAFQSPLIGLMAATPGGKGGLHSLAITESIFTWMKCTTHESFSLPRAHESIVDDVATDDLRQRLDLWTSSFLDAIDQRSPAATNAGN